MWTKETLSEVATQQKEVSIGNDKMVISKILANTVLEKGLNDANQTPALISGSLVDPKLSIEEIKNLPIEIFNELSKEILKFNGMDEDANQGN
jgi:hypothetical protein